MPRVGEFVDRQGSSSAGVCTTLYQHIDVPQAWRVGLHFHENDETRDFPLMYEEEARLLFAQLPNVVMMRQLYRIGTLLKQHWTDANRIGSSHDRLMDMIREKKEVREALQENPIFGMF